MQGAQVPERLSGMRPAKAPSAANAPGAAKPLSVISKRGDFLKAARARRQAAPGLLLQARARAESESAATGIRYGITCSRKIGNAVKRNRAKRRLRALIRDILPKMGREGWDYVVIARREETVTRQFSSLHADLRRALGSIHGVRR